MKVITIPITRKEPMIAKGIPNIGSIPKIIEIIVRMNIRKATTSNQNSILTLTPYSFKSVLL